MADTTYLAILKAAATAFAAASVVTGATTTITKPTGLAVSRSRATVKEGALELVVTPSENPISMDAAEAGLTRLAHEGYFDAVIFANGDPPEDALDAVVRWVVAVVRLSYSGGRFLTYATWCVPSSVEYRVERGTENEAAAVVRFLVRWHTAADDPALGV